MVWEGYQSRLDKGRVASGPGLGAYQTDVFGEMSMAINRADITVATIDALADIHVAELEDGCWAFVDSVRAYFALLKNSGAVADGITIIQPNVGSPIAGAAGARWFRQATVDDSAWLDQPEWHINAVTGNDENSGATTLTAIKTWAELRRRLGQGPITHTTLVFIDADLPADDPMIIDFELDVSFPDFLGIIGQQTLLHAGTFTAVASYNPAGNTAGSVTDAALPVSWTASGLLGKLILLTDRAVTDPAVGFPSGFVAKDLGAKTMRFSPFGDGGAIPITQLDPILNEAYSVVELTKVHGFIRSQTTGGSGLLLLNLEVDGLSDEPTGLISCLVESGWFFPINCIFSGLGEVHVYPGIVEVDLALCRFVNALRCFGGVTFLEDTLHEDVAEAAAPGARLSSGGFGIELCLRQGNGAAGSEGIKARRGGLFVVQAPFAIFDLDVGVIAAAGSQMDLQDRAFGQGVTVVGIEVDAYGVIFFDPALPPSMVAPVNQVLVGATPRTYATIPFIEAVSNAGVVTKNGY